MKMTTKQPNTLVGLYLPAYVDLIMLFFSTCIASSGTVTINTDSTVQILAEEAVPLERLDAQV